MNLLNICENSEYFENNKKIICIKGFSACYGFGIDNNLNLFIPDFNKGIVYRISKNFNLQDIFFYSKNSLKKNNSLKNRFIFKLSHFFFKKNFLKKPHDIFFDKDDNIFITEMGIGNGGGKGNVKYFDRNFILKDTIGLSYNEGKGLIDPVMSYRKDNTLFISEYGKSDILIYKNRNLKSLLKFKDLKIDRIHAFKKGFDNNYYLADTWNHRIIKFSNEFECLGWIGKTSKGAILDTWTKQKDIIKGDENGAFNAPVDIAFNNENIFISDCFNNRLVKIDYSGKFLEVVDRNLKRPYGIELSKGRLYIADKGNYRLKIIQDEDLNI